MYAGDSAPTMQQAIETTCLHEGAASTRGQLTQAPFDNHIYDSMDLSHSNRLIKVVVVPMDEWSSCLFFRS